MTVVLLASISLFALVVTSHPILSSDADLDDLAPTSSTLQTFVQTPFQVHPGKDDLTSDAARFHFEKSRQPIEYLSELGKEAAASFQVLSAEPPSLGDFSDEITNDQDMLDANSKHDRTRANDVSEPAVSEPVVEAPTDNSPSALLVVLVFSCVAALLALACIGLSLYIIKSLRSQVLASKTAWELLPRFWGRPRSQENMTATEKQHFLGGSCLLLQSESLLDVEEGSARNQKSHPGDKALYFDAVSDMESEWDDVDEKYQDALDMTLFPLIHDLPLEDNVSHLSHHHDLPLPHLGSYPLDPPTTDGSALLMRNSCLSPSPVSRPAWSVRAIDSPALGLSSRQSGVGIASQPLIHSRRRAYRSPVPEFDIALAMQLRPGLGMGADSAWMVRFLMAIFGWFAVALTGNVR